MQIIEELKKLGYLANQEEIEFFYSIKNMPFMEKIRLYPFLIRITIEYLNVTKTREEMYEIIESIKSFDSLKTNNNKILIYDTYFNMLKGKEIMDKLKKT